MSSSTSTRKKRKAKQSRTLTSSKNHHQNRRQEEQKCEEDHELVTVPYLPTHIVAEILSRVRIKALVNCRLVCKSWAALISTPELAQLQVSRSPTSCLIKPLNKKRQSKSIHSIDLECPYSRSNKLVFIPMSNLRYLPNVPLGLINSCNGLVCLCQLSSLDPNYACNIVVCNPLLKEYIPLPKPPYDTRYASQDCIFGFSHRTNQYKVVLRYSSSGNNQTLLYRLGEGKWKNIESAPYLIRNNNFYAFVNGALHWIGLGLQCPFICCFDFVNKQFRAVPEPSEFGGLEKQFSYQMHVGVINGNLSICDFTCAVGDRVVIWVMKDYGVKESWTKDIVITHMIYGTNWDIYEPIMIKRNGEILMIFNNESIMVYDPKSEAFESKLKIIGVSSKFEAIAHVPSFISLKDIAVGENLKVPGSN